jgi:hypothetical protein
MTCDNFQGDPCYVHYDDFDPDQFAARLGAIVTVRQVIQNAADFVVLMKTETMCVYH